MNDAFGGLHGVAVSSLGKDSTLAQINAVFRPYLVEAGDNEG